MTATNDHAGVLELALNLIPVLNDPDQPHYQIKPTDAPETIAAKVYDAFLYGLSDEQFQTLEDSAKRSPARAKELGRIKAWLDEATDILDEPLDPKELAPHEDLFSEFPNPDEATEDEDVLLLSWALIQLADKEALPESLDERLDDLEPLLFPDTDEVLRARFPEAFAAEEAEESETAEEAAPADPVEALTEGSALAHEEAEALTEGYDLEEGVDVPLTADATQAADEEVPEEAPTETEPAPEKPAKGKGKAKGRAEKAEKAEKAEPAPEKPAKGKGKGKGKGEAKGKAKGAAGAATGTDEAAPAPKRNRSLRRTGGGGQGVMSDMRRLVVADPDIPFSTVERVMHGKGVDCKKSTWSPKLSDMRNMLNYLLDLGVVDEARLAELNRLELIAEHDEDLSPEQAKVMDEALEQARKDAE